MGRKRASRSGGQGSRARSAPAAKRIVVKVGSAVIAENGAMNARRISRLATDIATVHGEGYRVVLVVSGAVAAGYADLGFKQPPAAVLDRQAAASVGQPRLIDMFSDAFARHGRLVAQLLMSAHDIDDRQRYMSARNTLLTLLERDIVPIINENDALSEHEAMIGDNDHLAALVAHVVSASRLVLLSRVDGLHDGGPGGPLIARVEVGSKLDQHITTELSATGVGGMAAKVSAARLASDYGISTVIANGTRPGKLLRVLEGEADCTLFVPRESRLTARKRWIAVRRKSRGAIYIDDGAKRAVLERGASLLPGGVTQVEGRFAMGARVDIIDAQGATIAVGLVSYDADDIRRIAGRKAREIPKLLGYEYVDEIVHRDNLVILDA